MSTDICSPVISVPQPYGGPGGEASRWATTSTGMSRVYLPRILEILHDLNYLIPWDFLGFKV